jgi:hypothetical protein
MAKTRKSQQRESPPKPLVWLHGEIKTPPFTPAGRQEAGMLLRLLQEGERLEMPQAESLPNGGPHCGALRVRDAGITGKLWFVSIPMQSSSWTYIRKRVARFRPMV